MLSQVQWGKDGHEHQSLLYCFWQKNTVAGQNYSSHKGEMEAFVWALKNLDSIIEVFTFTVLHTKVMVEDCISQEPWHLPDPTTEDYQLEREYESDPEPTYDLKNIAKK